MHFVKRDANGKYKKIMITLFKNSYKKYHKIKSETEKTNYNIVSEIRRSTFVTKTIMYG